MAEINEMSSRTLDMDDVQEALEDAICDGEGRANASHLIHHLKKRGIVLLPLPPEPRHD